MSDTAIAVSGSADENGKNRQEAEQQKVGIEGQVLASGFDSLVLSLSLIWKNDNFFKLLNKLKADAVATKAPAPGVIEAEGETWLFNVKPHGLTGYAWLLTSAEFDLQLMDSMRPQQRPSAMVIFRSAALWLNGVIESVDRIVKLLTGQGAIIEKAMASRVDPCLDILLPDCIWTPEMTRYAVKCRRAFQNRPLVSTSKPAA